MTDPQIPILSEQLDEILTTGVDDEEEALEVAALAGMLARLGADRAMLADAEAWRRGAGAELLEEAFEAVDIDAYVEAVETALHEGGDETTIEDAVVDVDELVAAAVWSGRVRQVAAAARELEKTVRLVPEVFAHLAEQGRSLARLRGVAEHLDVYGYWLAIADADRA